jgi:hypothetical protein
MQLTDFLFLAACTVSLIGGLYLGYRRGFSRGVLLGRDVEFTVMALAMQALETELKYANILSDVQVQYKRVLADAVRDLQK